jgi:ABC-type antimicrobial peptide transport system permease subunit
VADYFAAAAGDNWTMLIMSAILFILSFLVIANTMLLSIMERTRELGMMRALGMTGGELIFTMMLEAAAIGLIGSLIGMLIGCLINLPLVNNGIDYSSIMENIAGDAGYRINGIFRSAWNVKVIIGTGIVATSLSSVIAFFPTRRALKMPVIESLRFE